MSRFHWAMTVALTFAALTSAPCRAQTKGEARTALSVSKVLAGDLSARLVWRPDPRDFELQGGDENRHLPSSVRTMMANGLTMPVTSVTWQKSGDVLAINRQGQADVFDFSKRQHLKKLVVNEAGRVFGPGAGLIDIKFSRGDSTLLAIGTQLVSPNRTGQAIEVWDITSTQRQVDIKLEWQIKSQRPNFVLAPDGRHVMLQTLGLELYDLVEKNKVAALPDLRDVRGIGFTPDSRQIWAVDSAGKVLRWDPNTNTQDGKYTTEWRDEKERGLPPKPVMVESAVFSPDSQVLVTSHYRELVTSALVFWDNELGLVRRVIRDQSAYRLTMTMSPDGRLLAGFPYNGRTVHIWETITGREILQIEFADAHPTALSFSSNGKQLLMGHDRGSFEVWALQ